MRSLLVVGLVTTALGAAAPALAEGDIGTQGCGAPADVAVWLSQHFDETPLARGVQGDGRLFELYAAKAGATWTVVVTEPGGESCIVNEGTSLEVLPQGAKGPVA